MPVQELEEEDKVLHASRIVHIGAEQDQVQSRADQAQTMLCCAEVAGWTPCRRRRSG